MERFTGFSDLYEFFVARLYNDEHYFGPAPTTRCAMSKALVGTHRPTKSHRHGDRIRASKRSHFYRRHLDIPVNWKMFPRECQVTNTLRNKTVNPKFKPRMYESEGSWVGDMPDGSHRWMGNSSIYSKEKAYESYARKLRYWGIEILPQILLKLFLPTSLPPELRRDVEQELALLVVTGVKMDDVSKHVREHLTGFYRNYADRWGALSLHAPLKNEEGSGTLLDVLAVPDDWREK